MCLVRHQQQEIPHHKAAGSSNLPTPLVNIMYVYQWASSFASMLANGIQESKSLLNAIKEEAGDDYAQHVEEDLPDFLTGIVEWLNHAGIDVRDFIDALEMIAEESRVLEFLEEERGPNVMDICKKVTSSNEDAYRMALLNQSISTFIFGDDRVAIARILGIELPYLPPVMTDEEIKQYL